MKNLLKQYEKFEQVQSIAIGGSSAVKTSDLNSDVDIYIFTNAEIPVLLREDIVKEISSKYEVGGEYFGSGDEYYVDNLNKQFDVMLWDTNWFKSVIENVWVKYYPSNGYTTAFLYTLKNFEIIYDKSNWLNNLQSCIMTTYPEQLKQNIIKRNTMLMKNKPFASYYEQIEKAVKRNDFVSVNHRIAAFLASYFDVIFAVNELLHPGEKRLIQYAKNHCKILPENFEKNIESLLTQPNSNTLKILDEMVEKLNIII